jgi:hypothetical protein
MTAPVTNLDPTETMVGSANGVGLWIAPEGTRAPAAGAAFADPWRPLGYASDDGPTIGGDSTSEAFTPWQSTVPIRTVITERSMTLQFVMWQLNQDTLALYFDATVPAASAGRTSFDVRSDESGHVYAIAVDAKDGDNQFRVSFSRATLDSVGDMQLQRGAMVPLDVTLTALDDGGVIAHVDLAVATASALSADDDDTADDDTIELDKVATDSDESVTPDQPAEPVSV